jgi:hypothetical protein
MAEPCTTNDSSVSTERTAGQANVMPTAGAIGVAWRSIAKENLHDAREILARHRANNDAYAVSEWKGIVWAFGVAIHWLDDLEANAATSTHEVGDRSS